MTKSLVELFEEGLTARDRGLTCQDNPYPAGTVEHEVWNEGCLSAYGLAEAQRPPSGSDQPEG
jgi:hypothetical protein